MTNEAFARVKIDALLSAQGWDTLDTNAVRFEVIEQVVALLVEKAIAKDELSRRFGPEVYAALREQKSSGLLH